MPRYHLTTVIEADSESAVRQSWIDGEIGAIVSIEEAPDEPLPFLSHRDALVLVADLHAAFSMSQDFGDTFDVFGRVLERAGFGHPDLNGPDEYLMGLVDEHGCIALAEMEQWWPGQRGVQREAG